MKALCICLALVLGGCMTYTGVATTKDGKQVVCTASGPGIIGGLIAQSSYQDCMNQAKESQ